MAARRSAEFWQQHLEAWRQGGLTQVAYCRQHGLDIKSFGRWRRREDEGQASRSALTLIPVSVSAPASGDTVRIHSPSGWRVEMPTGSAPWLGELLRQLP